MSPDDDAGVRADSPPTVAATAPSTPAAKDGNAEAAAPEAAPVATDKAGEARPAPASSGVAASLPAASVITVPPAAPKASAPVKAPTPANAGTAAPAKAAPTPKAPAPPPPPPFHAEPSLPVSMTNRPIDPEIRPIDPEIDPVGHSEHSPDHPENSNHPEISTDHSGPSTAPAAELPEEPATPAASLFPGEIEGDFETILARVKPFPRRRPWLIRLFSRRGEDRAEHQDRHVAFDGFRSTLHDDKTERDRRYGTVYSVTECANAYLVRLELPRRLPLSALQHMWNLTDAMPDYDYGISLAGDALVIRAGVHGEAVRRLSYISASFPTEFLTRIELALPVVSFKHRMRDKVLELVVFKRDQGPRVGR